MISSEFRAKDLASTTWKDFQTLFNKYGGFQAGCWCMYYHRTGGTPGKSQEERTEKNHSDIRNLVFSGKNRSVLIYHNGKAIASAQYGTSGELPRPGNGRNYTALNLPEPGKRLWRITCFFVDRQHRRKSVSSFALDEILKRIKSQGGGIVEAYPVTNFRALSVWSGIVSMYTARGFQTVAQLGRSTYLVRKEI